MRKALLILVAMVLVAGLTQLFLLRFAAGDVYPPYSTLRADPLGARAFYDSLASLHGLSAQRNFQSLDRLKASPPLTFFWLGENINEMKVAPKWVVESLESLVKNGARLVFTFCPEQTAPRKSWVERARERQMEEKKDRKKKDGPKDAKRRTARPAPRHDEGEETTIVSLRERWGFDWDHADLPRNQDGTFKSIPVSRRADTATLPKTITWHTAIYFTNIDPSWRTIYSRGRRPVLVERPLGRGTIVFVADSYLLSNEGLRDNREPALLAWLVGPNTTLVFDETHLGVSESPGIMTLARQYRLHGLFAGLLVLAALFVWKNAASFVPPHDEEAGALRLEPTAGKDAAAGLVNLLRRTIPPRDLALVCFEEWKKSFAHRQELAARLARAQSLVDAERSRPPAKRQPVQMYRDISRVLAERQ
ncbi:MAG: hypothetical protein N2689_04430 [Verrucomicrobiae bacterium]|nr:hypothetical protein [Verrucomicrobiae bacterium]